MISTVEGNARSVVERLGGRWRGRSGTCRCPAHRDVTPSLSVQVGEKWPLFHCFAGCTREAVIASLLKAGVNPFEGLGQTSNPAPAPSVNRRVAANPSRLAQGLWEASTSAEGTPAERYLVARAIGFVKTSVRYHPQCPLGSGTELRRLPALIAPVRNALGLTTVQRTFLDTKQIIRKPFKKNKMVLGPPGDGCIRLADPADELGLAEGLEDAASAQQITGTATWAVMGTDRFSQISIPQRVRRLIIFGQNNMASHHAFVFAETRLKARFDSVTFRTPPDHEDWNDWLRVS